MIGLGLMGANMVRRLMRAGHRCTVFDREPKSVAELTGEGATGSATLADFVATLAPGRGDIARTPGREKLAGTAEDGYLHCGANGAGHFVKMVHNGIKYGIMAACSEGLAVLKAANAGKRTGDVDAETTPLRDAFWFRWPFGEEGPVAHPR